MSKIKSVLAVLIIVKFIKADYSCKSWIGLCSIVGQSVSATDPFVTSRSSANLSLLIISDGYMPEAPQTIFVNYPGITLLSIANTSLQEISPNVFTNAKKLTSLLLMHGYLTTLNNGTFSTCSKLQSLQVTYQKLSFIDIMAFQGLNYLQSLFLSNNQLSSINPQILTILPNLITLSLEQNYLTTLDSQLFSNNPSLSAVYFTDNQLTSLPNELFKYQTDLLSLFVDNNQLVTGQSYGANYVDMSNNKLRNFTLSSGESTVNIEDNFVRKIICSSTNLTVKRLFVKNNSLINFLCIRDMVNLTDLRVNGNKMAKPSKNPFLKLTNLRTLEMYSMTRFNVVPAKIFTPLTSLYSLRVDRLAAYKNLNITLPNMNILALTTDTWNCTYMSNVNNILKSQGITLIFNTLQERQRCKL